jgi:hypothetical protein
LVKKRARDDDERRESERREDLLLMNKSRTPTAEAEQGTGFGVFAV